MNRQNDLKRPCCGSKGYFFAAVAALSCVIWLDVVCPAAAAGTVAGCDTKVETDHQARAQALVAADVNETEAIYQKPDATAAMTCLNKLAGDDSHNNNNQGGFIFSGPFDTTPVGSTGMPANAGLGPVINDALQQFLGQNYGDADGHDSNMVDYSPAAQALDISGTNTCDQTGNTNWSSATAGAAPNGGHWNRVRSQGIPLGAPQISVTDLLAGSQPLGAGTNFVKDWNTEGPAGDNDFGSYGAAQAAETKPLLPVIQNNDDFCHTLADANIVPGVCP